MLSVHSHLGTNIQQCSGIEMSCSDDLTTDDLNENVSAHVLERVTAGEGSNTNLWGQIDRDK